MHNRKYGQCRGQERIDMVAKLADTKPELGALLKIRPSSIERHRAVNYPILQHML
jgi:hypothetical protein